MSLKINGLDVASMRFLAAWTGAWSAELEIMGNADAAPTGIATIATTDGTIALFGTVDAAASGSFALKHHARVIGGADGWRKPVRAQHYNSSLQIALREVVSTTAAEVGETAVLLVEQNVGNDYVRHAGTAAQVFRDAKVDWWVGLDGITRVGARPQLPAPKDLLVLDWQPENGTVSFTCPTLVEPGTVIIDARFGRRIVRGVEATVADASVTGTLTVAESAPELGATSPMVAGLRAIAIDATQALYGRFYEYAVLEMKGDRVDCAVVSKADGVPDLLPVSIWSGSSGYRAKLRPGSRVLVGFRAGDKTKPFVAFYEAPEDDGWRPVELDVDAIAKLTLGEVAAAIVLGVEAAALPIARAPAIQAFADAVGQAFTAAGAAQSLLGPVPVTAANLGGVLSGLGTAITGFAATMQAALPSSKAVAS